MSSSIDNCPKQLSEPSVSPVRSECEILSQSTLINNQDDISSHFNRKQRSLDLIAKGISDLKDVLRQESSLIESLFSKSGDGGADLLSLSSQDVCSDNGGELSFNQSILPGTVHWSRQSLSVSMKSLILLENAFEMILESSQESKSDKCDLASSYEESHGLSSFLNSPRPALSSPTPSSASTIPDLSLELSSLASYSFVTSTSNKTSSEISSDKNAKKTINSASDKSQSLPTNSGYNAKQQKLSCGFQQSSVQDGLSEVLLEPDQITQLIETSDDDLSEFLSCNQLDIDSVHKEKGPSLEEISPSLPVNSGISVSLNEIPDSNDIEVAVDVLRSIADDDNLITNRDRVQEKNSDKNIDTMLTSGNNNQQESHQQQTRNNQENVECSNLLSSSSQETKNLSEMKINQSASMQQSAEQSLTTSIDQQVITGQRIDRESAEHKFNKDYHILLTEPTFYKVNCSNGFKYICRYLGCEFENSSRVVLTKHQTRDHGVYICVKCQNAYFTRPEREACLTRHRSEQIAQALEIDDTMYILAAQQCEFNDADGQRKHRTEFHIRKSISEKPPELTNPPSKLLSTSGSNTSSTENPINSSSKIESPTEVTITPSASTETSTISSPSSAPIASLLTTKTSASDQTVLRSLSLSYPSNITVTELINTATSSELPKSTSSFEISQVSETTIKPYKCPKPNCNRSFDYEYALKSHFCTARSDFKIPKITKSSCDSGSSVALNCSKFQNSDSLLESRHFQPIKRAIVSKTPRNRSDSTNKKSKSKRPEMWRPIPRRTDSDNEIVKPITVSRIGSKPRRQTISSPIVIEIFSTGSEDSDDDKDSSYSPESEPIEDRPLRKRARRSSSATRKSRRKRKVISKYTVDSESSTEDESTSLGQSLLVKMSRPQINVLTRRNTIASTTCTLPDLSINTSTDIDNTNSTNSNTKNNQQPIESTLEELSALTADKPAVVSTSRAQAELVARRHSIGAPSLVRSQKCDSTVSPVSPVSPVSQVSQVSTALTLPTRLQNPGKIVAKKTRLSSVSQVAKRRESASPLTVASERPRECPVCHRSFKSKASVRSHFVHHHSDMPLPKIFKIATFSPDRINSSVIINAPGAFECEICGLQRFVKKVTPRHGSLACKKCAAFFHEFLFAPKTLYCEKKGECLDVDSSKKSGLSFDGREKCIACWIKYCFDRFQRADPWRNQIRARYWPKIKSTDEYLPNYDYDIVRVESALNTLTCVITSKLTRGQKGSTSLVSILTSLGDGEQPCRVCFQMGKTLRPRAVYGTILCPRCELCVKRFIKFPKIVYCQQNFSCLPNEPLHIIVPERVICKACKIKRWLSLISLPEEIKGMLDKFAPKLYPYSKSDNEDSIINNDDTNSNSNCEI